MYGLIVRPGKWERSLGTQQVFGSLKLFPPTTLKVWGPQEEWRGTSIPLHREGVGGPRPGHLYQIQTGSRDVPIVTERELWCKPVLSIRELDREGKCEEWKRGGRVGARYGSSFSGGVLWTSGPELVSSDWILGGLNEFQKIIFGETERNRHWVLIQELVKSSSKWPLVEDPTVWNRGLFRALNGSNLMEEGPQVETYSSWSHSVSTNSVFLK